MFKHFSTTLKNFLKPSLQSSNSISTRAMSSFNPLYNHTCLRVKDPQRSIEYYTQNFGFKLIKTQRIPELKFDLYFLSYNDAIDNSPFAVEGVLELTHNYGTENDADYKINNGNEEPYRGFGHICLSVDNIVAAEERLLANGVSFKKKLSDGRQREIAFALDPDGYWVELIQHGLGLVEGKTDLASYKFNHAMIRIKDPVKSLQFYREVLGMKVISTREVPDAKFTLYFLAFDSDAEVAENSVTRDARAAKESVLELTWNWGTEKDESFSYHNGNEQVANAGRNTQGYGHIGISLEDPEGYCKHLEEKWGDSITWGLKYNQGKMKGIAFIRDPDNYAIEILPKFYQFAGLN
ncbi:hypothetical protein WICPIJ_002016 [Wickerhamomyces pijperi]|uniref:lactoylglutathione lyase n=1 Tax=Wickerhamomyces pijperi TaxID=599730 RepID=A0A9P8TQK6_WICPI|nr:hypothetical protein WICPIJ_002016 [Wickerhamomyces pijperi]